MKNIIVLLFSSILLFACVKEKKKQTKKTEKPFIEYTFNDHGKDVKVSVTKTPQRAVLFTPHITEMFLALIRFRRQNCFWFYTRKYFSTV